jgi:hypothetical protein
VHPAHLALVLAEGHQYRRTSLSVSCRKSPSGAEGCFTVLSDVYDGETDECCLACHAATGYATATSTAGTWGPVVTGNIIVVGTDPGNHGLSNTASNTKTGSIALNDGAMSYVAGAHSMIACRD